MGRRLIAPILVAGALALAPAAQAQALFNYFAKQTTQTIVSPSGKNLGPNAAINVGDHLLNTERLYPGTSVAHAKQFTGTAALDCLVASLGKNTVRAVCQGELAFGSSMLLSLSRQTFGPNGGLTRFPLNGGTGAYEHARGTLHVMALANSNNSNFVIELN
jgi:hypothetical protein